jgi:hypothetical protein
MPILTGASTLGRAWFLAIVLTHHAISRQVRTRRKRPHSAALPSSVTTSRQFKRKTLLPSHAFS